MSKYYSWKVKQELQDTEILCLQVNSQNTKSGNNLIPSNFQLKETDLCNIKFAQR